MALARIERAPPHLVLARDVGWHSWHYKTAERHKREGETRSERWRKGKKKKRGKKQKSCPAAGACSIGWGREGLLLRRGLSTQPSLFHGGDGRESALGARWSRAGCAQAAASACASCIKVLAPQMLAGWGRCVVEARGRQSCHSIVQAQQHKSWQLCPISFLADLTARS